MQLTAPSRSLAPQAGQAPAAGVGAGLGGGGGGAGCLDGCGGAGGGACWRGDMVPTAAATGCGAPTACAWPLAVARKGFLQYGQRNCLPGESSPSCILLLQCGQVVTIGMAGSRPFWFAA